MAIVVIVIFSFFAFLTFVVCIWFAIAVLTPRKNTSIGVRAVHITEEDFWDEVDGGTYVTMSDGSVRLDNNGKA